MGILDEAIREHLDLKRRRGADPTEVAKQEGEVFGAPRRAAVEAPPDVELELDEPVVAEVSDHQTHLRLAEDAAPEEDDRHSAPELEVEPEESSVAPQPELLGQETRAFDPDEVRAAAAAGPEESESGDEDVLDETPEFLAETPEHDRLWFEQRPPRDFDF